MKGKATFDLVGGKTKFYGAALYRFRESDFREVVHETGVSPAWPISYGELEPYYCEAELLYRVHGAPDGDPSEPPRSAPYPFPPLPHDPMMAELIAKLRGAGASVSAIPLGLDHGHGGNCVLCAACDGHLCDRDAKMDAEVAALRPALRTGLVELVTQAECVRILIDTSGTGVTGVLLRTGDREQEIRAGIVALGCGFDGSPLLLRRSGTSAHPEGLGNNGGALGRYLAGHHAGMLIPLVGWKPVGVRHTKTFGINMHYEPSPDWPYPTGIIQMAGQMPLWEIFPGPIRPLVRAFARRCLRLFYMTEAIPTREAGFIFKGDRIRRKINPPRSSKTISRLRRIAAADLRAAGYRVMAPPLYTLWHSVGTARMGDDPASSVTDRNGMVHGIRGLYVVDASVLPTAGAVNTGLTIIAVALRTGSAIVTGTPQSSC
jgi:choline dehydrogenase-like flavoprotein